jgi:hypothetical protein
MSSTNTKFNNGRLEDDIPDPFASDPIASETYLFPSESNPESKYGSNLSLLNGTSNEKVPKVFSKLMIDVFFFSEDELAPTLCALDM